MPESLNQWYDRSLRPWLDWIGVDREFYGNSVGRWLAALLVFLVAVIILRLVKAILTRRAAAFAERYPSDWAAGIVDLFQSTRLWFVLIAAAYLAALIVLYLPESVGRGVARLTIIVLLVQAGIWGNVLIAYAISRSMKRRLETDAASATMMAALAFLAKLGLWSVAVLLILENVGVDVTALIAGLGVGGIAVALAAQNILGDLFASLSIVLDKPFVLGDFIIVGNEMGTVERIGLKTTRIRSLSGEQLIFSNNDLLQSRIRNYKRMEQRRIVFTLGVTYQTPAEKLAAIPGMIRAAVEALEKTRFDRAHFKAFGDFAMVFETVYFVLSANYGVYMDIQQAINLDLLRRFEQEGIEFAYPTQTVFVRQETTETTVTT